MTFDPSAIAGTTYVVAEEGHFVIYVEVMFLEEIVRKKIRSYSSLEQAETAARLMGYAVNRDLTPDSIRVEIDRGK